MASVRLSVAQRYVGGIAAALPSRVISVDSESLAQDDAVIMLERLGEADLYNLPPRIGAPPSQPQGVDFEFTVDDGHRQNTVAVAEDAMPAGLEDLLDWLRTVPGHDDQVGPPLGI
jgi:hypothetical protein